MSIIKGKHIILGVTGSIAAYKVAELARNLTLDGAIVDVIMTAAAQRFVGAATFQALTGRPVLSDMWALPEDGIVGHVSLGQHADLLVIAPATANTIARLAAGLCDDLLTTTALATTAPILIAPAMNPHMYEHPATQANIALLRQRGVAILEPAYGRMAEPVIGRGRLPEPAIIEAEIRALLGRTRGPLRGCRVVVTAGGTQEPIDPVRFIGNRASGRMGYAIAAAARDRGASVTLISGPATAQPPAAVTLIRVETALDMQREVMSAITSADLLIMNAAVADFRPATASEHKIKKGDDEELTIRLVRNPDILASIAHCRDLVKVGFAAETHDLLTYAREKLERKGLDMIVANEAVASIGTEDIQMILIDAHGVERLPRLPKSVAAERLLDAIIERFAARLRVPEIGIDQSRIE
ncbi:MAG: bifunctional phosphopantothenoylcysteine decarboxylase/phosphopantothenate--cysteine ligase CoaBC [Roseiflexus sp.]|jgi:phosphopantothenoylcysteine decarboxylase/phosphopantothenate--cysteine ligase|nr:bifunctional phosphopantothenoylcysteine decarboxylase/phosphopantothenate--cysteine ligase CoaBC [Roseiflexus sp.]MBO9335082.1 bifunctional phosphopantothenoylcysteine decarboxylase/phosphopantothenate--cysteine ligase CoaBC [Roseiflexus sp.]MBO9366252.1 bifunctional phosphopantothenoylcysteine decarboxylase/phosphopantothenate--cysteine ligase CoaBC [Roseiflexus sp.]MBO9383671.1 bifunctional phosphopantothenoylcysteine decarboxylase/phosphopantothenate--cysteine ligase CoaBC [Roseiflexus sp